ncbi:MAG: hypothetical protein JSS41_05875, partial [Proteobacteria bacterium]|nr:hypothetical protein [Pseudomonadota bacterium]
FLTDASLLDSLARDKLATTGDSVRAEGWAWVETTPRITSAELHGFQHARRNRRTPNKTEAKRIAKLQARQQAIDDRLNAGDAEDIAEEEASTFYEESDKLGAELDTIEQSLLVFAPEILAMAGAVVTVDHSGEVVIHRGLLREAEAKALRARERQDKQNSGGDKSEEQQPTAPGISEKLARRLSAHRTAALQAEVARHPQVALVAVVHRLALRVMVDDYGSGDSPINISASPQNGLDVYAPDMAQSPAAICMREARREWAERLPRRPRGTVRRVTDATAAGTAIAAGGVRGCYGRSGYATRRHVAGYRTGTGGGPRHAPVVDTDRRRLLRPCVKGQGHRGGAGVRAGARGAARQAQEERRCQRSVTAGGRHGLAAGDAAGSGTGGTSRNAPGY